MSNLSHNRGVRGLSSKSLLKGPSFLQTSLLQYSVAQYIASTVYSDRMQWSRVEYIIKQHSTLECYIASRVVSKCSGVDGAW